MRPRLLLGLSFGLSVAIAWLAWISVLGWSSNRTCIERLQQQGMPLSEELRRGCDRPVWRAPVRGLDWTMPPDALLGYWLLGTAGAVVLIAALTWIVASYGRRRGAAGLRAARNGRTDQAPS